MKTPKSGAKAPMASAKRKAAKPKSAAKAKKVMACSDGMKSPSVKPRVTSKPENYVFGRPTAYDPSYCEIAVKWGGEGKSKVWIATEIGVVVNTLDNWMAEHPDFLQAMMRAKQLEQRWWEDAGQQHLTTTGFSASAWSRSMAARFPKDWREKTATEHSGNVQHRVVNWMTEGEAKARGWLESDD